MAVSQTMPIDKGKGSLRTHHENKKQTPSHSSRNSYYKYITTFTLSPTTFNSKNSLSRSRFLSLCCVKCFLCLCCVKCENDNVVDKRGGEEELNAEEHGRQDVRGGRERGDVVADDKAHDRR